MWRSHVSYLKESCQTYEGDMSYIWRSHVTYMNEFCHTCEVYQLFFSLRDKLACLTSAEVGMFPRRVWKTNRGALDRPGCHNNSFDTSLPRSCILHSTLHPLHNASISTTYTFAELQLKKKVTQHIIIVIVQRITLPKYTTDIHIHHFKTTFMCPRSFAGVPFDSGGRSEENNFSECLAPN